LEILLSKEFVVTDIEGVIREGKSGNTATKEFFVTDIAEDIRERKIGNTASKRSCRY
jgi:hypothetical protein